MLSEEEKARIKTEEYYRYEIRDELSKEKQNNINKRIWTFVNSSIFLWFLSTVAVGSITYVWTHFQNKIAAERIKSQKEQEEANAKKTKIANLNLEIEGRLSQFLVDIESMVIKPYDAKYSLKQTYTVANIREKWDHMKMPPKISHNVSAVYPEYFDRGIISLLIELDKLQKEMNMPDNKKLRKIVVDIQDNAIFENKATNDFLPIYIEFNKNIMKWNSVFPYMDCNTSKPFC